nr:putative nucleotidyltransferase substrate binding domain-containing protein [Bacillus alkalicola]
MLQENPHLYFRLYENVAKLPKPLGVFGQFLTEQRGEFAGMINIKENIVFPYVNSLRLLAYIEEIYTPSTLERFESLSPSFDNILKYKSSFQSLQNFRIKASEKAVSYSKIHHIDIKKLKGSEKNELKMIANNARRLFYETKKIIEDRCR